LDELGKLPRRIERPRTFMEIGGYAHSENICSNLLAFFFDPKGPHGLGSLFLDALVDSVGISGREEGLGGNVSVEREVTTGEGNRIDLLIRSDSHAVLIENKIYAAAINPFEDYAAYLGRLENEDSVTYENRNKVLLTLYPSRAGAKHGFVNLTHADFVSAVRSALGHYVSEAEPRYLPLLLDFLNTLEHFGEGTRMNQEYIKLLAKRNDEVEEFLTGLRDVRAELKGKVRDFEALIDVDSHQNVQALTWKPNIPLAHFLQYRILIDEKAFIFLDTRISPSGWEIQIASFGPGAPKRPEVEDLLNKLDIGFESYRPFEKDWRCIYRKYPEHIAYDEDLSRFAPVVKEMVDRISRHIAAGQVDRAT